MNIPYVNKLRIFQLYEPGFDTMLKHLLVRRLMRHSAKHMLNGHQLFGLMKRKSTYDALVTVRVIYNMECIQRVYLISIFNELKGNYDRVSSGLNAITTQQTGLTKNVAVCHVKALRKMKHFLRTAFGISIFVYNGKMKTTQVD